jgi:hypothetical protein
MPHYPDHLIMGVAALAATLLITSFTISSAASFGSRSSSSPPTSPSI